VDTAALTREVAAALAQLTRGVSGAASVEPVPVEFRETMLVHDLSGGIHAVLASQEEFARPRMIGSLSGASGFGAQFVAPMLLHEARRRGSAEAAVAWLEKVLGAGRASGIVVATFWGLIPKEPVSLARGVELMPFDALPPSRQKDALSEPHVGRGVSLAAPAFSWQAPTAALVRSVTIEPYLREPDHGESSKDAADCSSLFADIRVCLATCMCAGIVPGPGWFQYTDSDLEAAVLGFHTHLGHQEITPLVLEAKAEFDPHRVSTLLSQFMNLDSGMKNRVRTSMQRLAQACLRREPADRALELAIALEALLVDAAGEHTFKIGLRVALLTPGDRDERKKARAIIEAMYKIRSSLMHSGQTNDTCKVRGHGEMRTAGIVSTALEITASVIQRVVAFGAPPDWSSLEVLGGT